MTTETNATIDEIIKAPARETWQYGVKTAWYTLDQINSTTWCVDEQSLGPSSEKWQGMLAEMVRRSP